MYYFSYISCMVSVFIAIHQCFHYWCMINYITNDLIAYYSFILNTNNPIPMSDVKTFIHSWVASFHDLACYCMVSG